MQRSITDFTLITGVIGEDVHVTGIRIMEHALRTEGFNVFSLGIHNTPDEFVKAALEHKADAILVSSLCGHAEILVRDLRSKCADAGIGNIHLCLGGQLVIHEEPWSTTEHRFLSMGFDRVHRPFILPNEAISALKVDLNITQDSVVGQFKSQL